MADNPQVRAGTAGGTITVAADEVTIYGALAQIQGIKIHDGLEGGTIGARVNSQGELVTHQANSGTVSVSSIGAGDNNIGNVDVVSMPTTTVQATDLDIRNLSAGQDSVDTELTTADLDTGAGSDTRAVVGIAKAEFGGAVLVGSATPMPTLGTAVVSSSALPTGAATLAEQQTQTASLSVLDDWDETDRAKVNPIVGQAGVTGGAGAVAANTPRVTLASDDPAVVALQTLDNIVAGSEAQVDVVGSLPAGTNNIGDVDVLTVPADPFGANADAAVAAGATGSIQAKLRRISTDIDSIKTAVETLDNIVAGSEAQVDVLTMPTVTVTDGLNVEGDVAHDGADSGNPVKQGAKAVAHGANPTAVAAGDRTDLYANRAGIPFAIGGHPNVVTVEAAYTAAQTDVAIVTVAGGLKIVVTSIAATLDEATTVGVGLRVGFAAATTPTTTGVVMTHPGLVPGGGFSRGDGSGILGIGADGEDLRITSEVPTTGSLRLNVSYYTVES